MDCRTERPGVPDGRFVGLITPGTAQGAAVPQINVTLNWFEELKARVPTR